MRRPSTEAPFLLMAIVAGIAAAQPRLPTVAFEVASVKPAAEPGRTPAFCIVPCSPGERVTVTGSRVDIRYLSLYNMILSAYRIKPFQLSGPEWMHTQRFDIAAKIPDGVSKDQLPEMLQALLAERFKLSIHRDSKELPVYALVVGKTGSKLQPAAADADIPLPDTPGTQPLYTPQGDARMLEGGGFVVGSGAFGPMRGGLGPEGMKIEFLKLTMPALAEILTPHMDRPVVDMTNLKGGYYWKSESPRREPVEGAGGGRKGGPPEGGGAAGADPGHRQDPFGEALTAMIEKGGLKLESRKAPVEIVAVDRVEKMPTAN
jgi:uncharacterized protein (TIGR03435 family)